MRIALLACVTAVLAIAPTAAGQITDPVADFLHRTDKAVYRPSFPTFHLDDELYRFDLDLNRDGSNEVLVSSSLDRDGKQGNVFYVYRTTGDGFENVGKIHLSPNGFYVGQIEELNRYGIVNFLPSGGGTGAYIAYLLNGRTVGETPLGSIDRNPSSGEIEGDGIALAAKYSDSPPDAIRARVEQFRANGVRPPETSAFVTQPQKMSAAELTEKYKINVEETTLEQALRASVSSTPAQATQAKTLPTATPNVETVPAEAQQSGSPAATAKEKESARTLIILVSLVAAGVLGTMVIFRRRRSR